MKKTLSMHLLAAALVLALPLASWSQPDLTFVNAEEFLLEVERTDEDVIITCHRGCGYTQLMFGLREGQTQVVHFSGTYSLHTKEAPKAESLQGFAFTVQPHEKGLMLEGLSGTSWTQLAFNCLPGQCRQRLDPHGMLE